MFDVSLFCQFFVANPSASPISASICGQTHCYSRSNSSSPIPFASSRLCGFALNFSRIWRGSWLLGIGFCSLRSLLRCLRLLLFGFPSLLPLRHSAFDVGCSFELMSPLLWSLCSFVAIPPSSLVAAPPRCVLRALRVRNRLPFAHFALFAVMAFPFVDAKVSETIWKVAPLILIRRLRACFKISGPPCEF
jgi:hypothetical protein